MVRILRSRLPILVVRIMASTVYSIADRLVWVLALDGVKSCKLFHAQLLVWLVLFLGR